MTWTRLDDGWTDDPVINDLPHDDRWHYLAMIQFCSRTKKFDGIMRAIDANRCSDHPDAPTALKRMAALGLVTIDGATVRLNMIDDHIPPPSVRDSAAKTRIRVQRSRKHKNGDHSECLEGCDTRTVTPDVTRYPGTGQDRTGPLHSPNVTIPGGPGTTAGANDPDRWPTEDPGLAWRNVCEEKSLTTVPALMSAEGLNEAQAKNLLAAAFPGRRF